MARNISQFKHSPSDKRGLGLTFLGMMANAERETPDNLDQIYDVVWQLQNRMNELQRKLDHLMLPWWKRLWLTVRTRLV